MADKGAKGGAGGSGGRAAGNLHARIKKMMQSDEDVGKVAKASPALIGAPPRPALPPACRCAWAAGAHARGRPGVHPSAPAARALDIFLEGLVGGAAAVAQRRGARMLTASHMCAPPALGRLPGPEYWLRLLLPFRGVALQGSPEAPHNLWQPAPVPPPASQPPPQQGARGGD